MAFVTVSVSGSTMVEGPTAAYVYTGTLSAASQGVTTIQTDRGDIVIADGVTTGTLTVASGNREDVYIDPSSQAVLIRDIISFHTVVSAPIVAFAHITDTLTDATVSLSGSTTVEGWDDTAGADLVVALNGATGPLTTSLFR